MAAFFHPRLRALVSLALLLVTAGLTAAPAPRLNVLFIVADDLRNALGAYGDPQARTPNIDRLAARGVRFDRAYVQYTVCNPSRTSFLTGLRPEQTGIVGNATYFRTELPEVVTLPQLFRQNGARAESYGKIYHAGLSLEDMARSWLDLGKSWDKAEMYQPTALGRQGDIRDLTGGALRWCRVGEMDGTDEDQPDGIIAREVIAAMERLDGQPWFLGAGFHRPHDPFLTPKKYWDLYPEGSLKLWKDPVDATPIPALAMGDGFGAAFAKFTDRERMDFLRSYYAGVSFTDANVGKLMATMDRLKLWERTVVVFIGDHGYHLGERGWWNKHTLYERSCRAPLIICAPGVKPGVARGLVEFVDLYPTLAELGGLPAPAGLPGQSLRPLLADPSRPGKPAAFTLVVRGQNTGRSVRTDRWRYIEWNGGADGSELYDHERDAQEMHNVAVDARHAKVIADMKAALKQAGQNRRPETENRKR